MAVGFTSEPGPNSGGSVDSIVKEVDNLTISNTGDEEDPRRHVIWPVNGLEVDSLSALLKTLPDINLVEHVSRNGYGMIYWTAFLTLAQAAKVAENNQVYIYSIIVHISSNILTQNSVAQ